MFLLPVLCCKTSKYLSSPLTFLEQFSQSYLRCCPSSLEVLSKSVKKIKLSLFPDDMILYISSVQFSRSVVSDSWRPHESQHARPPCPSPTPGVYPNSCPSSWWCHPAISSSVIPLSSCPQSFPALGSFPVSQIFAWGGQSIGVSASASVLPVNTQDWSPLGWTGWTSLQSRGLSWVQSQKHKMVCSFPSKPFNITVIQVYAPTTNAEEAEVDWFYVDL